MAAAETEAKPATPIKPANAITRGRTGSIDKRRGIPSHLRVAMPGSIAAPALHSPSDAIKSPVTRALEGRKHLSAHPTRRLQIILGSSSSARRKVMATLGQPFSTMRADIDEKAVRHADPYGLPVVVAAAKCEALLRRVRIPAFLITADQVVLAPVESGGAADAAKAAAVDDEDVETAESKLQAWHDSVAHAAGLGAGSTILNYPGLVSTAAKAAKDEKQSDRDGSSAPSSSSSSSSSSSLASTASNEEGLMQAALENDGPPPGGNGRAACTVELREKPVDEAEARRFVQSYSGSWVQCVSGLVVHNTATGQRSAGVDVATCCFHDIPEEALEAALALEDNPLLHSSGAVVVECPPLQPHVKSLGAPLQSVMGLPVGLLRTLLKAVGWNESEA